MVAIGIVSLRSWTHSHRVDMAQQQADAKDVAEQALARSQADYRELVCRGHQLETRLAKANRWRLTLFLMADRYDRARSASQRWKR